MADNLGDNWWEIDVEGNNDIEDDENHLSDTQPDDGVATVEPKHEEDEEHEEELCDEEDNIENIIPQTKSKKRKQMEEINQGCDFNKEDQKQDHDAPVKKKSKRKRISKEILSSEGASPSMFKSSVTEHFNQLSSVEIDEITLEDRHFSSHNNENNHTISSYLKLVLPKWHRICSNHSRKMSPLILVVCSNALRACQLNRDSNTFKGKSCKSLKLFSRHMKLEKQSEILKSCVSHFAVGTPERLKALLQQDSLSLSYTKLVVLDWNWRDVKLKRMIDIPQVQQSLMTLLKDHVVPACKNGFVKIGLF